MDQNRHRPAIWLASVLLVLGLLRLFSFAAHDPLLAYANQFDMARTSACVGLWPDVDANSVLQRHPSAPLNDYHYGLAKESFCLPSTEVAIVSFAIALDRVAEWARDDQSHDFTLRQLAILKALLVAILAVSIHWLLRRQPMWQAGHALAFLMVFCDPFNLLYLGTLYTEFGALLGAWWSLSLMLVICLRRQNDEAAGWPLATALALGMLVLGGSRMQHLLLAPVLVGLLALWLYGRRDRTAGVWQAEKWLVPAMLAVCAVLAMQLSNQQGQTSVAHVNRINMFFAAVLPATDQPERMLQRVGLPAQCGELVHVSWFLSRGHQPLIECPEIATLSRARVATALLADPIALARLVGRGVLQSTAWRLPYLGEVADSELARAPARSLSEPISGRGFVFQVLLWGLPLLLLPLMAWRLLRGRAGALDVLGLTLGSWVILTWGVSLIGDGYSEFTRHLHLAQNAILLLWLIAPLLLAGWIGEVRRRPGKAQTRPFALAGALFVGCLLFAVSWSRLPMAMGLIDHPNGEQPVSAQFDIDGWLLSTHGIKAVRSRLGNAEPVPLQTARATEFVRNYFPINAQRSVQQFHGTLQAEPTRNEYARLSIEVDEGNGEWREVNAVRIRRGTSVDRAGVNP